VGQIVGTYRALGTRTRIRGSGNRRDPRPTVSAKFSTATFAQMIDGSSQLALRIVLAKKIAAVMRTCSQRARDCCSRLDAPPQSA
jgi:hypothetical protein